MLERINSPEDLQYLSYQELDELADEIRDYILRTVSVNGGHLASNLGTVELSIALNRVYHAASDRIVFDVGHQSYTHKILNGRREQLTTLRQYGGISGFPKPYESDADAFIAGHSSDSLSVAYGMARARSLLRQDYDVCAVIGDGALTGGPAYEGLENIASSDEPIVIILNDNTMSINRNVGALSGMLKKLRVSESYYDFKRRYRSVVGIDTVFYKFSHKIKEILKEKALAGNMFTALGLNYLGPVNGHDIAMLEEAIRVAKDIRAPVLLHVITQKGKGYRFAEEHPEKYHGVGSFDIDTGEISFSRGFSDVMGEELCALAEKNDCIVAITAAMAEGTGLHAFSEKYPKRFFDVGICEAHAVSMAAGMAKQGMIPVFAVYSSFLQRAYDMLIHDVSLLSLHVVFCVDRCGLVGRDGETHNGSFDVSFLSSVPGMTVLCPASFVELKAMLRYAIDECSGPVAIRYPRGGEKEEYRDVFVSEEQTLLKGKDVTMVCYGTMTSNTLKAAELLKNRGISPEIIKLGIISPNRFAKTMDSLSRTKRLVIAEDVCEAGSVGTRILAEAASRGIRIRSSSVLHLGSGLVSHGSVDQLQKFAGLDAVSIADAAESITEV